MPLEPFGESLTIYGVLFFRAAARGPSLLNVQYLTKGGMAPMSPRLLLHLEAAAVLTASLFAYRTYHGSWLLFAVLFLAPDISMIGYLLNARVGATSYNAIHTYVGPFLLAGYALWMARPTALLVALIWVAHIGFDRMLGFGLKYPSRFKDTHLSPQRHAELIP
jgi:Domain of unknown function (DUF4260)